MSFDFDEVIGRRGTNSVKWGRYAPDVLPLWVADMDFRSPPPIALALREAVDHGIFGYENPTPALRAAVATRMERLYGWKVDPGWVVTVTGLVSGFYAAARAFCRPGDGYLIQPPVYMPFNDLEAQLGLLRQEAPLEASVRIDAASGGDAGKGAEADSQTVSQTDSRPAPTGRGPVEYTINWDVFSNALGSRGARTGMFLLCDPHNPVGIAWDEPTLRRMAELALGAGAVIVSDEIHAELLLGATRHRPVASLDPAIEARSVTLVAPSKTFNIAGLYCGFAIVPDPKLRLAYEAEVERMTLHSSSLSLIAAAVAYSGACDDWLVQLRAYLEGNRDFLSAYVASELPGLGVTRPEATYLAWLDCRGLAGRTGGTSPAAFFLDRAKVALNDGATFGSGGAGFARLNFACPRSTLEEALERIGRAIKAP